MLKKIKNFIKNKYNDKKNIELIKHSDLFSKKYYLMENSNIKGDAAKHYYYYGFKNGKSPSYDFSNDMYLKMYKDVANSDINPLIHYLKYGYNENRKIYKDKGYSLSNLYFNMYNSYYRYNIYNNESKVKKVNFFIEDNWTLDNVLFNKVIKYCKKNNYKLRIIYKEYDISSLKILLKNCKIEVEFLYLNNNDYIFASSLDIIICTGLKTAFALSNSVIYDKKIYLYLNDFNDSIESLIIVTKLYYSKNVIFITNNYDLNDRINLINLNFEINKKKNYRKIFYYSNEHFIFGLLLFNKLFLDDFCDMHKYEFFLVKNCHKFHFDVNMLTYIIDKKFEINENNLFYIKFDDNEEPCLVATIINDENKIKFNIIKTDDLSEINDIRIYDKFL